MKCTRTSWPIRGTASCGCCGSTATTATQTQRSISIYFRHSFSDGAILAMHDVLSLPWGGPLRVFVEDVLSSEHFGPVGLCWIDRLGPILRAARQLRPLPTQQATTRPPHAALVRTWRPSALRADWRSWVINFAAGTCRTTRSNRPRGSSRSRKLVRVRKKRMRKPGSKEARKKSLRMAAPGRPIFGGLGHNVPVIEGGQFFLPGLLISWFPYPVFFVGPNSALAHGFRPCRLVS